MFDFYAMTWVEWCYYSNGLYKNKVKEWEHTRTLAWLIYKSNADPKKAATNMLTWLPLPTDNNYKVKAQRKKGRQLTKKQRLEFFNRMR